MEYQLQILNTGLRYPSSSLSEAPDSVSEHGA